MEGRQLGGRYHVIRYIGGGGMASVYLAQDMVLDRYVAIKTLHEEYSNNWEFIQRFIREAKTVGRLSHPNVVSVYDTGVDNQVYYMVMEFIDGASLAHWIREKGPLSPFETISIAIHICNGLAHAHDHGIIHRDIKPHNILFTQNGQIKVSDFGISRFVESNTSLTQTGIVIGTVDYFSPEQARGLNLTCSSDLYSVGVVLYEMLTGRTPFSGTDFLSIALQHIQEPFPDPISINPHVPDKLRYIIHRATQKDPIQRYQSAYEMANDLQHALLELQNHQPMVANSGNMGHGHESSGTPSLIQQASEHAPKLIQELIQSKNPKKHFIVEAMKLLYKIIKK
ncbi:protein kinase domain-containing protein [Thermoflavimicrobium daqui]|uniref:Serine/threonine-protein kinase PrkC n=1 Tax=Thermoflavimicrobium daqui TaxID=2137476 RepID=A0A364K187_9BACL|nr:protein kinase [Thermoflavimicrobium daqui]RAL21375.1 serine/threonine protein kinase [Thermoflavimicrobium daqui]